MLTKAVLEEALKLYSDPNKRTTNAYFTDEDGNLTTRSEAKSMCFIGCIAKAADVEPYVIEYEINERFEGSKNPFRNCVEPVGTQFISTYMIRKNDNKDFDECIDILKCAIEAAEE